MSSITNRFDCDACRFESGSDLGGQVVGPGRVAMHADGVSVERHDASVNGDDVPLLHHPHGAYDDGG